MLDKSERIAQAINSSPHFVKNAISLFESGATIPFISRYRKERTGGMNEVQLFDLKKLLKEIEKLEERRIFISETLKKKNVLTAELEKQITLASALDELEDIYLPFKEKKKTRAQAARENGLQPLAETIVQSDKNNFTDEAKKYLNEKVKSVDDALQGARDIIAEIINENFQVRKELRILYLEKAFITSSVIKTKKEEGFKYKDYFEYKEKLSGCASHRLLALLRGEKEKFLRVSVDVISQAALQIIKNILLRNNFKFNKEVEQAMHDSFERLLHLSIENETLNFYKEKADKDSVKVFSNNLRQLLLAPPFGQKRVLAIDPGFRSGCKVVCLDEHGTLQHNETIYPHTANEQQKHAASKISTLVAQYKIDAIAIGNGTAGRETENFIQHLRFERKVQLFIVNEDGASVYSASAEARKEFPDYDVTVRGAISIGRRLMDPLAELIKINPGSIGVGQYQHDVDSTLLEEELSQTVESCVNTVGVNVNTASEKLLTFVSGIGASLAKKIIDARAEQNGFANRESLKKIKGFGAKAFEQSAGFLRISGSKNPLDNSAVHPESYKVVERIAKDVKMDLKLLIGKKEVIEKIDLKKYVTDEIGLPTLTDIAVELSKPGRDVRGIIKLFEFDKSIRKAEDLIVGNIYPGMVTNITKFGAFVDVGAKQDGLVHISQLDDEFISDVNAVVKLNQHVKVKVLSIDLAAKRIQFSLKGVTQ